MERQQSSYRRVLELADRNVLLTKQRKFVPTWQRPIPDNPYENQQETHVFSSGIGQQMAKYAHDFNFFQFCRLLEIELGSRWYEQVRFRRRESLSFPSSEIYRVETTSDFSPYPNIYTTFLGLYGVDAAMPAHFLNDIALHKEGWETWAHFLDIFNHAVSQMYYRAWRKYRYAANFIAGGQDEISQALLHFIGNSRQQSENNASVTSEVRLLGLLGVFQQRTRTSDGLESIVRYVLPNAQVQVDEFVPQWIHLNEGFQLGKNQALLNGSDIVLGKRVRDANHLVSITIMPCDVNQFIRIFPNGDAFQSLMFLLSRYLGYRSDAEIWLEAKKEWLVSSCLNGSARLGFTSALGQVKIDQRIRLAYYTRADSARAELVI